MYVTAASRTDESSFHPPSQMINPKQEAMVQTGLAASRAGSSMLANNEETFRGSRLSGGVGSRNSEMMYVRTFTCDGNPCCIPVDILTLCHCCTGSICFGYRPTLYDRCTPNLFKDKNVEVGEECFFYCCYDCCFDWFPKKPEHGQVNNQPAPAPEMALPTVQEEPVN